jgi:putative chitinase
MCIKYAVGEKSRNDKVDAQIIQAALNLAQSDKFLLKKKLVVDGNVGQLTVEAIKEFQAKIINMPAPDGRVDPQGNTLSQLKIQLSKGLTEDSLLAIMGQGSAAFIKPYLPLLKNKMGFYQINTPLRVAHFLAQLGHESLSLTYTEEMATGAAYEGRIDLGNTEKGDGIRFKGRGLIQLTGRKNYADYGNYACLNLLTKNNERLISVTPAYALDVSLWFWQARKLNAHADKDDLRAITRRINGGFNGLVDREAYLSRAKFFLLP